MEDDNEMELLYSPLGRRIEAEGTFVIVSIYRSANSEWFLEVVDEDDGSTVWSVPFPTDTLAFAEFEQTLATDGIHSFSVPTD